LIFYISYITATDTKEMMEEMLVKINPTGKQEILMNVSVSYSKSKKTFNRVNKEIKKLENYIREKEIDDMFENTDGDLYDNLVKKKNILKHKKVYNKTLSVNIIYLSNALNKKFHLLKNNLELIKRFRNEYAELIFEDKDTFSDRFYKSQLENLDKWYKEMECVMKVLTDPETISLLKRIL